MNAQWKNIIFWTVAILVVVLATVLYQPAAAKTGALLVWTKDRVYIMDIDTLTLQRVGPASIDQKVTPSPGCTQQNSTPCWVVIGERIYRLDLSSGEHAITPAELPVANGYRWSDGAVSWSPDGLHIAYSLLNNSNDQAELWVYNVATRSVAVRDENIDPGVAVAWTTACSVGLDDPDCELGYKQMNNTANSEFLPSIVGFTPASGQVRRWIVSPQEIFELRWSPDNMLLYSQTKREFIRADDHTPAYYLPHGGKLANMSPDGRITVYYQPFTLEGCALESDEEVCLHLGVWLKKSDTDIADRQLIYSVDLSEPTIVDGLNFVPVWSPSGSAFVFFQEGNLVHYDTNKEEATIWHKPVTGKLRSVPVFAPNEGAVAFIDNQGQGFSEYRLVIVNPKLQPVEEILSTQDGFNIIAWLAN